MENAFFDHGDNNSNKKASWVIIGDKAMMAMETEP